MKEIQVYEGDGVRFPDDVIRETAEALVEAASRLRDMIMEQEANDRLASHKIDVIRRCGTVIGFARNPDQLRTLNRRETADFCYHLARDIVASGLPPEALELGHRIATLLTEVTQ